MEIRENQVFKASDEVQSRDRFRRVVSIFSDRVFYSIGSDDVRSSLVKSFKNWVRTKKCLEIHEREDSLDPK